MVQNLSAGSSGDLLKYMATKFYKVIEWMEMGYLMVEFISTKDNPADGMTKVSSQFHDFTDILFSERRGSVEMNCHAVIPGDKSRKAGAHDSKCVTKRA